MNQNKCITTVEAELLHSRTRTATSPKSTAKFRQRKQAYLDSVKTPCIQCGERRKYVIDFHHIDPDTKLYNINKVVKAQSWDALNAELKKCICLCRNCHQEFHYFYGSAATKADLLEYLDCDDKALELHNPMRGVVDENNFSRYRRRSK